MKSLIDEKKISNFYKYLDTVSLTQKEKNDIKFLIQYLKGKTQPKLSNKTFLFYGDPGLGKSYIVESIIDLLKGVKVIYLGCSNLKNSNIARCNSLQEAYSELEKTEECVIFIDDFKYVADYQEVDGDEKLANHERKTLMRIIEHVKRSKNRIIFLSTLNDLDDLEEAICDRIEVRIEIEIPSERNRSSFVKSHYSKCMPKREISYLNKNLVGYNYREIPEVIKIAYREGKGKITRDSIKEALNQHTPSSLSGYDLMKGVKLKFDGVIGRNEVKGELTNLMRFIKKPEDAKRFDIKKCNILLFHGRPGTGKSYMAKALAGELGYSLLDYDASRFYRWGAISGVRDLIRVAKRFKNCVVFVDEADKLFDKKVLELDADTGPVIGELNRLLEGVNDKQVESVIVFTANHLHRFPQSFLDRVRVIEFKLPDHIERQDFIKKKLANVSRKEFEINREEAAALTQNCSFRDLEKVWRDAVMIAVSKGTNVNMKIFKEALETTQNLEKQDYLG